MHAASCHVQVKHRWEELSEQEKQQVTQLAYQHLQDGEQRVPRGGGGATAGGVDVGEPDGAVCLTRRQPASR